MDDAYYKLVVWEKTCSDVMLVNKVHIDIAGGDLVAGILLSQLIYWNMPDKEGNIRLRVIKDNEYWLAKRREDWWDECRITPDQFDRACKRLEELGLIEKKLFKFNGVPTIHIKLNYEKVLEEKEKIEKEIEAKIKEQAEDMDGENSVSAKVANPFPKTISGYVAIPFCQKPETQLGQSGKSLTKITTEITTEITNNKYIRSHANNENETSLKQEEEQEETPTKNKLVTLSSVQLDRFNEFWRVYPKKKAKVDCMKAWKQLNPNVQLFEEIMVGLRRAMNSKEWKEQDGKFIPYPATFLRQGRWMDEYEEEVDRWAAWEQRSKREFENILKGGREGEH